VRFSKPATWVVPLFMSALFFLAQPAAAGSQQRPIEDFVGCFLLYDLNQKIYLINNNENLSNTRFSPCSTFKVPHAIIGLDLGLLKDGSTVFKWDGRPMYVPEWEKDHTLNSAMANSVVWYFQKLAKQIGPARMSAYLAKFDYGNQDISGRQDLFWLESSLKISPQEQIGFLKKLAQRKLPVSQRAMAITKQAIMLDKQGDARLFGKTGSGYIKGKHSWGWFVGWVESHGKKLLFTTYIQAPKGASGGKAKALTLTKLRELGLWRAPAK
jgi:bla regulator protein BlaR1